MPQYNDLSSEGFLLVNLPPPHHHPPPLPLDFLRENHPVYIFFKENISLHFCDTDVQAVYRRYFCEGIQKSRTRAEQE